MEKNISSGLTSCYDPATICELLEVFQNITLMQRSVPFLLIFWAWNHTDNTTWTTAVEKLRSEKVRSHHTALDIALGRNSFLNNITIKCLRCILTISSTAFFLKYNSPCMHYLAFLCPPFCKRCTDISVTDHFYRRYHWYFCTFQVRFWGIICRQREIVRFQFQHMLVISWIIQSCKDPREY